MPFSCCLSCHDPAKAANLAKRPVWDCVAWISGPDARCPSRPWSHAARMYSGRPRFNMGFSATVVHKLLRRWLGQDEAGAVSCYCPGVVVVPFKANAEHRHHIPKQRHRATNSPAYDAALRQRGSLTVWFTDVAIAAWKAEPRTTRGGQSRYSALAIATALTLRSVFRLALRQTGGLIGSIIALLGLDVAVPDRLVARRASKPGQSSERVCVPYPLPDRRTALRRKRAAVHSTRQRATCGLHPSAMSKHLSVPSRRAIVRMRGGWPSC